MGANYIFNDSVTGIFIFPVCIAIIVAIIGFFMGNDSPESYGLDNAEDIFEEPILEDDKAVAEEKMPKLDIFKKYVRFNKVI